jgi:hypothetical protein
MSDWRSLMQRPMQSSRTADTEKLLTMLFPQDYLPVDYGWAVIYLCNMEEEMHIAIMQARDAAHLAVSANNVELFGQANPRLQQIIVNPVAAFHDVKDCLVAWFVFFFAVLGQYLLHHTHVRTLAITPQAHAATWAQSGVPTVAPAITGTGMAMGATFLVRMMRGLEQTAEEKAEEEAVAAASGGSGDAAAGGDKDVGDEDADDDEAGGGQTLEEVLGEEEEEHTGAPPPPAAAPPPGAPPQQARGQRACGFAWCICDALLTPHFLAPQADVFPDVAVSMSRLAERTKLFKSMLDVAKVCGVHVKNLNSV